MLMMVQMFYVLDGSFSYDPRGTADGIGLKVCFSRTFSTLDLVSE
jgi:hypothetical protein